MYNTIEMVNEEFLKKLFADVEKYKTAEKVTVVAASKTVLPETIDRAYDAGITDFGENRVQELLEKYNAVTRPVKWHFIGRLQTNKVKYIIDKVRLIHSVDSEKLLAEIDRQAKKRSIKMPVLIEVNMGREPDKGGVFPENAEDLCSKCAAYPNVELKGLMCLFPIEAREGIYGDARDLYVKLKNEFALSVLSMGMSADYIISLKCGATIIRPGRAIFGERQ